MAFSLAGFAEGLHPALQAMAQRIHEGQVAKLALNNLMDGNGDGQQPSETATPLAAGMAPPPATAQPIGGGQNPLQGLPGSTPLFPATLQAGGAPSGAPPPGAVPAGGPPAGGIGASPAGAGTSPAGGVSPIAQQAQGALGAAPQVQPGGPPPPPQTPPMSGVAQPTGNQFQDTQKTLRSMLLDLKRRNPNARPADILAAAGQEIALMKGLQPEQSDLMRLQIANMTVSQRYDAELQRAKTAADAQATGLQKTIATLANHSAIADANNKSKELIAKWNVAGREQVAGTAAGARLGAAQVAAQARIQAQDMADAAKEYGDNLKATTDMDDKDIETATKVYLGQLTAATGAYKAQAGAAAHSFSPAPAAPATPGFRPPARRAPQITGSRGEPVGAAPAASAAPAAPAAAGGPPPAADQPPAPGARKAPDGNWYVADPKRKGKYLKVNVGADARAG